MFSAASGRASRIIVGNTPQSTVVRSAMTPILSDRDWATAMSTVGSTMSKIGTGKVAYRRFIATLAAWQAKTTNRTSCRSSNSTFSRVKRDTVSVLFEPYGDREGVSQVKYIVTRQLRRQIPQNGQPPIPESNTPIMSPSSPSGNG